MKTYLWIIWTLMLAEATHVYVWHGRDITNVWLMVFIALTAILFRNHACTSDPKVSSPDSVALDERNRTLYPAGYPRRGNCRFPYRHDRPRFGGRG